MGSPGICPLTRITTTATATITITTTHAPTPKIRYQVPAGPPAEHQWRVDASLPIVRRLQTLLAERPVWSRVALFSQVCARVFCLEIRSIN